MKILRRSVITYYSINFSQHKNYNFNDAKKALDDFALAFERVFSPGKKSENSGLNGTDKLSAHRDY